MSLVSSDPVIIIKILCQLVLLIFNLEMLKYTN